MDPPGIGALIPKKHPVPVWLVSGPHFKQDTEEVMKNDGIHPSLEDPPTERVVVATKMQSLLNAKFLERNKEHRSLRKPGRDWGSGTSVHLAFSGQAV